MKQKLIIICLLAALALSLFSGCETEKRPMTENEAYAVVYTHAGVDSKDVSDPHLHVLVEDGVATYNIHFSAGGVSYDYTIDSITGEILSHTP